MTPDAWGFSDAERLKSPTGADMRAALLAAEQNCVLSTRQLHGLGLRDGAITTRVRRGTLHRVHRGVYSVVHPAALSIKGRLTAAVLACGDGAVLSHRSAAAWWELLPYEDRAAEVIVPGDGGRKIDAIRAHRTAGLDRRDAWWRSGIPVSSPARTALDVAATMPQRALRRMLRQAQAEGRLAVGQLREAAARAGRHPGARAVLAIVAEGPTPTRSVAEDLLLDLIERARLPRPEVNPRLQLADATLMPDLLWRPSRLVVEVDGLQFHCSPEARLQDGRRQALLEAHGHRVLRVTYEQLTRRPRQTIARIEQALGLARAAPDQVRGL